MDLFYSLANHILWARIIVGRTVDLLAFFSAVFTWISLLQNVPTSYHLGFWCLSSLFSSLVSVSKTLNHIFFGKNLTVVLDVRFLWYVGNDWKWKERWRTLKNMIFFISSFIWSLINGEGKKKLWGSILIPDSSKCGKNGELKVGHQTKRPKYLKFFLSFLLGTFMSFFITYCYLSLYLLPNQTEGNIIYKIISFSVLNIPRATRAFAFYSNDDYTGC